MHKLQHDKAKKNEQKEGEKSRWKSRKQQQMAQRNKHE